MQPSSNLYDLYNGIKQFEGDIGLNSVQVKVFNYVGDEETDLFIDWGGKKIL